MAVRHLRLNMPDELWAQFDRLHKVLLKSDTRKGRKLFSQERVIRALLHHFFLAHSSTIDAAFLEVLADEQQRQQPRQHRGLGPAGFPALARGRSPKGRA